MTKEQAHRRLFEEWWETALPNQRTALRKVLDVHKTFKELDTAITSGEYEWLYKNPMTGKIDV